MTDINARIQGLVDASPVFLFMKGTPTFPQCGFSATVISILDHLGVKYESANILEDAELRQGIKDFSNWPTIPQQRHHGREDAVDPAGEACRHRA